MRALNSPWLALACLLAFLGLAYASLHRESGYTHSVFSVLDKKPPALLQRQAIALRSLYNLTDEDAIRPIRIFDEP